MIRPTLNEADRAEAQKLAAKASEFLCDSSKWSQGMFRTAAGQSCLLGASFDIAPGQIPSFDQLTILSAYYGFAGIIASTVWNDDGHRTFEEVRRRLDLCLKYDGCDNIPEAEKPERSNG